MARHDRDIDGAPERHDVYAGCGTLAFGIVLALAMWGWILGIGGGR